VKLKEIYLALKKKLQAEGDEDREISSIHLDFTKDGTIAEDLVLSYRTTKKMDIELNYSLPEFDLFNPPPEAQAKLLQALYPDGPDSKPAHTNKPKIPVKSLPSKTPEAVQPKKRGRPRKTSC
jgi:hypothetical protein